MSTLTRRLFLRNTAAIGAAGVAATVPANAIPAVATWVSEEPMSLRDQAIWHMRELERLAIEDGAQSALIAFTGQRYPDASSKTLIMQSNMDLWDEQGMFGDAV